ncbi:MAG: hypothetical protein U0L36_01645 [Acutalibacteraceae bacterium]|nr:hypothetical protein [Acutalibacteraceae bacterium]
MFQNIKVDIIYYKTNTDFEMEFNLCGCCRMRLLTDKAPDKKTLVHSLARAVSRSRVIIIVGNLFGEEGVISLAAGAVGSKLSKADNKTYGISGNDEIEIISGSTPLVTPEGYFGGCIIEKGPQTMILLSDSKSVRKTVMKTLIHPYIEELCAIELKEKAASATPTEEIHENPEPIVQAAPETEDEPVPEATPETADTAEEIDFVMQDPAEDVADENTAIEHEGEIYDFVMEEDTDEDETAEEETVELLTDVDEDYEIDMVNSGTDIFSEDDGIFESSPLLVDTDDTGDGDYYEAEETLEGLLPEDEQLYEKRFGVHGAFSLPILIVSVLIVLLLAVLCYCIFYVPSKDGVSAVAFIKETFNTLFG